MFTSFFSSSAAALCSYAASALVFVRGCKIENSSPVLQCRWRKKGGRRPAQGVSVRPGPRSPMDDVAASESQGVRSSRPMWLEVSMCDHRSIHGSPTISQSAEVDPVFWTTPIFAF